MKTILYQPIKKDKTTGQIYKTHILVTKELLRSANGFNNLLVEIPYVGCIGSKSVAALHC